MNKTVLLALLICLGVPSGLYAKGVSPTQSRLRKARLMNQTTRDMMELTFAVVQYSQDHNGKLPPMRNLAVVKKALRPYATASSFSSVASRQPFVPNSTLSGRALKSLSANDTVLFYDSQPILGPNSAIDLYRVVGYLGHTIAMPEKRWQRTKKELGVP